MFTTYDECDCLKVHLISHTVFFACTSRQSHLSCFINITSRHVIFILYDKCNCIELPANNIATDYVDAFCSSVSMVVNAGDANADRMQYKIAYSTLAHTAFLKC